MKRTTYLIALTFSIGLLAMSCQRNSGEVLEDSKTAARYMGKGFKSLGGKHSDSRQINERSNFAGPREEEYIPLSDEDLYRQLTLGDSVALSKITQDTAIPQSRETPGEKGSSIPNIEGFIAPERMGLAEVFRNIHFDTNDYTLRGHENLGIVDHVADYMQKNPRVYLFVEGHCDERGAAAYNLALGSRRSNSVRNLLVKGGVDMNRVFTISYGKERPLVLGKSPADWRKNRRVQFKLYESL